MQTECDNYSHQELIYTVANITILFEKHDELKEEIDEVKEEIDEVKSRRKKDKKISIAKKLERELTKIVSEILEQWDFIKDKLDSEEKIKKVGNGDLYLMVLIFRIKKDISCLIEI